MLKKLTSALWFVASLVILASCSKPPPEKAWTQVSPDGKFSVLMPGQANEETRTSPNGLVSKTYQLVTVLNNVRGMAVGYAELKDAPKLPAEVERVLDQARDQANENLKGRLLSESKVQLKGYPGREIQMALQKDNVVRQRMYVVNRRLYNIMAITTHENIESPEARKFFDSFQILE